MLVLSCAPHCHASPGTVKSYRLPPLYRRLEPRQVNKDQPNVHRDALELRAIVLVTKLAGGQHATLLQMPVSPHEVASADALSTLKFIWRCSPMAEQVVLERLNKLVAKGYVVRWGESEHDTLRLEHPRPPDLTLFADGRIWVLTLSPDDWISADNDVNQRRFQSFVSPDDWIGAANEADEPRFKSFVARVPKPTMLQSLKAVTVEDVCTRVAMWTLVGVLAVALTIILVWAWWFLSGE